MTFAIWPSWISKDVSNECSLSAGYLCSCLPWDFSKKTPHPPVPPQESSKMFQFTVMTSFINSYYNCFVPISPFFSHFSSNALIRRLLWISISYHHRLTFYCGRIVIKFAAHSIRQISMPNQSDWTDAQSMSRGPSLGNHHIAILSYRVASTVRLWTMI